MPFARLRPLLNYYLLNFPLRSPLRRVASIKGQTLFLIGAKDKIVTPRPQGISLYRYIKIVHLDKNNYSILFFKQDSFLQWSFNKAPFGVEMTFLIGAKDKIVTPRPQEISLYRCNKIVHFDTNNYSRVFCETG
jgi:hypothetical protein